MNIGFIILEKDQYWISSYHLSTVLLSIYMFLHKRISGERSRRHPVCILIAMALRIFLYLAFSLIFMDFHWFSMIFICFLLIFIDFHYLAPEGSRTVCLSSRLVNRAENLMRSPKNMVPEAKNEANRFGSIRFGSVRFGSIPILPIWRWCRIVLINRRGGSL